MSQPQPEPLAAPFRSGPMRVEPAWADYNDHLNLAYYHVLFDRAVDAFFETLGCGETYARASGFTTYAAEAHVRYLRELKSGALVVATCRIVDHDAKRMHLFQELFHEEGWLAATLEVMSLSIDRAGPRVAPFPPAVAARIAEVASVHARLPRPDGIGRGVGLTRGRG